MGRRRRRRHHRRTNFRVYVLITLACGLLALVAQMLAKAPATIQEYANESIKSAVRDAVKQEAQKAAAAQQH